MDLAMFVKYLETLTTFILLNIVNFSLQNECKAGTTSTSGCICETQTAGTIDLTPLSKGPNPRFDNITGIKYLYAYQPCTVINRGCGNKKLDIAICQEDKNVHSDFTLGLQSTSQFEIDISKDQWNLTYKNINPQRKTIIILTCDDEIGSLNFVCEDCQNAGIPLYVFELKSKYACRHGSPLPPPSDGISTGTILVIIFCVLLFSYLLTGMLFLRYIKGAQGTEMVPNYEFWRGLPAAIRDGAVFVWNGCKADNTYTKI